MGCNAPWLINIGIWGATQGLSFPEAISAVTAMLSSAFAGLVRTIQQNPWLLLFGPFAQGLRVMGSAMAGGVKWMSKGLANAGKTYSNFLYGKDHNCPTASMCGIRSTGPGLFRAAQFITAIGLPGLSMLIDPAFTLGFITVALDFTVGAAFNLLNGNPVFPTIHYSNGGYWLENSGMGDLVCRFRNCTGFASGPFAFTPHGASLDTILHEKGHLKQYGAKGGWGMVMSGAELEWHNDVHEFTHGYKRGYDYLAIAYTVDEINGQFNHPLSIQVMLRWILMETIVP